jgi:hypothetical protein
MDALIGIFLTFAASVSPPASIDEQWYVVEQDHCAGIHDRFKLLATQTHPNQIPDTPTYKDVKQGQYKFSWEKKTRSEPNAADNFGRLTVGSETFYFGRGQANCEAIRKTPDSVEFY